MVLPLRSPFSPCFRTSLRCLLSICCGSGLALVVGLVLYISSINDEVLNRTRSSEAYFTYKYGWSFAFAAVSFLLTEVRCCCVTPTTTYIQTYKIQKCSLDTYSKMNLTDIDEILLLFRRPVEVFRNWCVTNMNVGLPLVVMPGNYNMLVVGLVQRLPQVGGWTRSHLSCVDLTPVCFPIRVQASCPCTCS